MFGIKYMVSPYELTKKPLDILSVITSCLGFGGLVAGVEPSADVFLVELC